MLKIISLADYPRKVDLWIKTWYLVYLKFNLSLGTYINIIKEQKTNISKIHNNDIFNAYKSCFRIVAQVGLKNNCTFCGVFRRQALDRGAMQVNLFDLGSRKLVQTSKIREGRKG